MKKRLRVLMRLVLFGGLFGAACGAQAQVFASASAKSAQRTTETQPVGTARTVKQVLTELESRFNVTFAFDETLLRGRQATGFRVEGHHLERNLSRLLDPQYLRFQKVKAGIYVIVDAPKKTSTAVPGTAVPVTDLGPAPAEAATAVLRPITGRVVDGETNEGVAGVNVLEKDTRNGTSTDAQGNFRLNVSDGATTLVLSSIGYVAQEVPVGAGQSTVNVTLAVDVRSLDEVVVVSYGTRTRANLTESVGVVNMAEAKKIQAPSVVDQIQGRVAGVTVAAVSGAPGATPNVQIRGSSTFGSNGNPIYIIDGVIIGSAAADFNPNDIESMTILKDAAATALYGSRGMNGAIVITTKRGKAGKPRVEYSGYYGVQEITKRLPLAGRDEYIRLWTLSYQNGRQPVPNFGIGNYDTDWQEELMKPGAITDQNLSFSGGSETSNYLISANYFDQDGTIVGPRYRRYAVRINSETRPGRFTIGESVYLAYLNSRNVTGQPFDQVVRMPPTMPVYDPNNLSGYGFGSDNNATFGTNPIGQQLKDDNTSRGYKLLGNAYAEYRIADWLNYRLSLSLDYYQYQNKFFARPGALSYNSPNNPLATLDDTQGRYFNTIVENTLNFSKSFGSHSLSGLVGYTRQRDDRNEVYARTEDIYGEFYQQNAGTANPRTGGFSEIAGLVSYLGRVIYSFDDRYVVQANLRRDASSRFPRNNQVAYFPSASVAWNISRENFMKGISFLNDLKLRASYGSVGNQAIRPYQLATTIAPNLNYVLNGQTVVSGASNRALVNPNLRWERKVTADVGIDASFLNNKFQVTADYFRSESKDLLLEVPVPFSSGNDGPAPYDNLGGILNKGLELSATYQDRVGKDFRFSINGQITSIRNRVLQLVPANGNLPLFGYGQITRSAVDGPIAGFYVLRFDGIFQNQAEIDASAQRGTNVTPGDVRWKDTNGRDSLGNLTGKPDGEINFDDREIVGTPFPKLEYGLNLAASYKGFDFTLFFQGVAGNLLFNRSLQWTGRYDDVQNIRTDVNYWTGPGTSNTAPKPIKGDPTLNPIFNSDRWVERGDYGRIRTAQIGYNFPKTLMDRWKMASARVYVNAQNLLTLTKYSGYNPDVVGDNGNSNWFGRGIDQGNYPVPRTLSLGLQLTF
jgi:TonB-linked SusC/RagA family outer membrane protein